MEYLLFRLYGPLASWGEIAVGESRHTASYPGKSALLGLLAAALGIRRDEEDRQLALATGYHFAVKVISVGSLLRDYHTTQVPNSIGSSAYHTRRDEIIIGRARLGTILSSREYRCDSLSLIAVRPLENAPYTLEELCDALLKPKFHLYLGRKACPLAAPLKPVVRTAKGFRQALDEYPCGPLYISDRLVRVARKEAGTGVLSEAPSLANLSQDDAHTLSTDRQQVRYYWEGDTYDLEPQQILTRHDQPLSRKRWQFTQRVEHLFMKEVD
ncbi:MAG TPA: type I-E CRISPR-associated protein Cas5/CasD [Desulfobacteraceae bacterium]|nr:type I-E CRISPR-associated protein Cas5/CasD [Desulfobacteraceae bacterium]HPJ67865.1 type I-E CRISPR-associated protein Cas5/CasD [Desulfobacteraceae bacterium]HPQ28246.1 type I-E CRISPR-associated protein Cas5/CasD [Desulfobacteraceae bacterium]